MEIMYILVIVAGIIALALFYFIFSYIALWIQALVSGAKGGADQYHFHAVQKGAGQTDRGIQDHGGESRHGDPYGQPGVALSGRGECIPGDSGPDCRGQGQY